MGIFKENIQKMKEYDPPQEGRYADNLLLLDFNERTLGPPQRIRTLLSEYAMSGPLNLYPEYNNSTSKLARYAVVDDDQVLATNGSDQAIKLISDGVIKRPGRKVIIPKPTFAMFEICAEIQSAKIEGPRYKEPDLSFPLNEVINKIDADTDLVWICNPNNPTGTITPQDEIKKVLEAASPNTAVAIDECYYEFSGHTSKDLVNKYPNLLITRSLSKFAGIPSVRIGYIISQKQNIEQLRKIRGPYDVNGFVRPVIDAFYYPDTLIENRSYIDQVMTKSKPLMERFFHENGIKFYPSGANFILVEPTYSAKEIAQFLDDRNIRVRLRPDPPNTLRVSIGTVNDTNIFIETFSEFLESQSGSRLAPSLKT